MGQLKPATCSGYRFGAAYSSIMLRTSIIHSNIIERVFWLETRRAYDAIGRVKFGPTKSEQGSLVFRRSIYVVRDLAAGETLSPDSIRIIRPGYGLAPKYYDRVLGATVRRDTKRGTPVSWDLLI